MKINESIRYLRRELKALKSHYQWVVFLFRAGGCLSGIKALLAPLKKISKLLLELRRQSSLVKWRVRRKDGKWQVVEQSLYEFPEERIS